MSVAEETKVTKPVWGTIMFIVSVMVMLFGLRLPFELVVILTILVNLGMIASGRGEIVIGIWSGVAIVIRAIIFWLAATLVGGLLGVMLIPTAIVWVLFSALMIGGSHVELSNAFVDIIRWIFMTKEAKSNREKHQAAILANQTKINRRASATYTQLLEFARNQSDDAVLATYLNNIMAVGLIDARDYRWFEYTATKGRGTKWQYNIAAAFSKSAKQTQQMPSQMQYPLQLPAVNPAQEFMFSQSPVAAQSSSNYPAMPSPAAQYQPVNVGSSQPMFQPNPMQQTQQMPAYQPPAQPPVQNGAYYNMPAYAVAQPSKKEKRQQLLSAVMPYVPNYWDGRNEIQPPSHFGDAERGVFWDLVYKQPYGAMYKQWKSQMGQVWKAQANFQTNRY